METGMANIDTTALYKLGYGLYVITCNDGEKDNGMIGNTVMQVASAPTLMAVGINKANYSHDVIKRTGMMNVNCLTVDAPFALFERFGFHSGRDTDKLHGESPARSENGLAILGGYSNAFMSLKVENYMDMGSHGLFICTITEARVLSDKESMTYAYYHANVKPKPEPKGKKGWVCKICGYVHEGETLPDGFVCPICKHGAEDFEPVK